GCSRAGEVVWERRCMQVELVIYVASTFGLGFLVGYAMRALISSRRRRRTRLSRQTEAIATGSWRLERPAARPDFTQLQLRRGRAAPSMRDPAKPDGVEHRRR